MLLILSGVWYEMNAKRFVAESYPFFFIHSLTLINSSCISSPTPVRVIWSLNISDGPLQVLATSPCRTWYTPAQLTCMPVSGILMQSDHSGRTFHSTELKTDALFSLVTTDRCRILSWLFIIVIIVIKNVLILVTLSHGMLQGHFMQ